MKVYTRTGDEGTSGLFSGPRLPKDHRVFEAIGAVDELNCAIGVAVHRCGSPISLDFVREVQSRLFDVGAELATIDPESKRKVADTMVDDDDVAELEAHIDRLSKPLRTFVLPSGPSADFHHARAVCRRAERRVVAYVAYDAMRSGTRVVKYLNRLSDLLFAIAVSDIVDAKLVPWTARTRTRVKPT